MKLNNKGQGLSLTTIIVAAIALIVLVVLVMIFTGRIGVFKTTVEETGEKELVMMRFKYGDCRPGTAAEEEFLNNLKGAGDDSVLKDQYRSQFNQLISDCKEKTKEECTVPCIWKT